MMVVQVMLKKTGALMRLAAVLLAVGQAAMGFAPLLEKESASATAHVETSGTQLHYAHDESGCIACVAHRMAGGAPPSRPLLPAQEPVSRARPDLYFTVHTAAAARAHPPTGPPSPEVV